MTKTPRLSDLQLILLSHAAQRDDGSLLPVPEKFAGEAARIGKAIPLLLKHKLVEEAPIADRSRAWRDDDDQQAIGLFITGAGRALIAGDGCGEADRQPAVDDEALLPVVASEVPPAVTKIEHVLVLLRGADGATIAELTAATGWLPHSTRAALTGLRKKGHPIERVKRGDVTCYRIVAA